MSTVVSGVSGSSGLGWSPGWGHCVVFLGKTRSASFHPLVYKWIPENLMPREPGHLRFACILEKCFTKRV